MIGQVILQTGLNFPNMWTPISIGDLYTKISEGEDALKSNLYEKEELFTFWRNIEINPEKWIDEDGYSKQGGGFYVVASSGRRVIWYNDIEDGFNISFFDEYGIIRDYSPYDYVLNQAVFLLYNSVNY